ncbi:hypothetical protein D3C85_1142960 [compost metagenome]
MEGRAAQAVASQFDAGMVHGHADLYFVEADAERALDADAVVGGQQDEGAFGDRVPGAGDDDREGVSQQAAGQGRTGGHQVDGGLWPGRHHLEVVAAGENARLAGDDHHGAIFLGLVERSIERGDHIGGDGVDLAIAERQGRDAVFELVGNQLTHDTVPCREVEQTLPSRRAQVKRRD